MLEVYSSNVAVIQGQVIPLNSKTLQKGHTATLNGATISLNANGVYMVSVDAVATSATPGDVTIQLYRDGVAVPDAVSSDTIATADDLSALGFTKLVSVQNGGCRCYETSTELTLVNVGVANTIDVNVVVTKVC